ncbi:hypothetical protein [Bradyrhizobium elkanii]|uniref:hypothetical protein n=1 Tax=Bradyrhizobium elkanii TaxID=29448 RepID=UPI0004110C2E|nr:hypothetical protein [Bradyrhizobium elkanii]
MKHLVMAAAAALLTTTAAQAENVTRLYTGNYWQTSHYARNSEGRPMCVISGQWTFPSGAIGTASMKWSNETGLFMHISKSNWAFPADISVPMSISFDRGVREGSGTTITSTSGSSLIQISIASEQAVGFVQDFADADQLVISFKEGNEPPWTAQMIGSRHATKWFKFCIAKIANSGGTATSPVPRQPQATSPVPPTSPVPSAPVRPGKKDDGSV